MMDRRVLDYVLQAEKPVVSPIWGGRKPFEFMCMGYLSVAQALGFRLRRISDSLEVVEEDQLTTREQLDALIEKREIQEQFAQWEVDYLAQIKSWNIYEFCGGGCFGPLTVVSCILGIENMLRMTIKNPKFVEDLLEYVTEYLKDLARREHEVGQDFFWIAEPVASVLAPRLFWKFCGKYLQQIFQVAKEPGFLHVCGNTKKQTKLLEETGAKVLSIDYCTDLEYCLNTVDQDTIIMGNVSPMILQKGTKEEVTEEIEGILSVAKEHQNFILSTGCSIMEGTPEEHMELMFELANK